MGRLDGRVVLISGAARGQGEAEARLFAEEGARVGVGDVLDAEGAAVAGELGDVGCFVHLDVRDASSWARFVAAVRERWGRVSSGAPPPTLWPNCLLATPGPVDHLADHL